MRASDRGQGQRYPLFTEQLHIRSFSYCSLDFLIYKMSVLDETLREKPQVGDCPYLAKLGEVLQLPAPCLQSYDEETLIFWSLISCLDN